MEEQTNLKPTVLVIFGITGDLSRRYLLPALSQVCKSKDLPPDFKILGISRRDIELDQLFGEQDQTLKQYSQILKMDLEDADSYRSLAAKLQQISGDMAEPPQIILYLVVPPAGVLPIIRSLGKAKLNGPDVKLMLEKPFGVDLDSACELIVETEKYFKEDQIYRIDHYLAKEMAQNITVFLGSNGVFRGIWNNQFIESIEIVVTEEIDIEGRVAFYDATGALRDVGQSHLLQLAALTLMEPCSDIFDFEEIPRRRLAALKSLRSDAQSSRRAQYEGYAQEVGNPGSQTETFFDIKLSSDNKRWEGVPVRLVSGKALDQKLTEIRVNFKKINSSSSDLLIIRIQPREGIELYLWFKEPGYDRKLQKLPLSIEYGQHFGRVPDAYEQVLVDAMKSNHSLFASSAEVVESWRILQPVQDYWAMAAPGLKLYKKGSTFEQV
jgi:glucose-6-phosphate 1-dehydrogenase